MSHDTNLAADHGVSADLSASGYPGLGSNDRVFSYFHIVGHLDQIVQLHTFANNGSAHCGPVNGIIGANLNIVFNNHISNLAHLGIRTIRLRRKSKAIAANHRAGMRSEERRGGKEWGS